MSLKNVATTVHIEQLERMWNELAEVQGTLGAHEAAEIPGISGHDIEWDLGLAMLHVRRAQMRVCDVLGEPWRGKVP